MWMTRLSVTSVFTMWCISRQMRRNNHLFRHWQQQFRVLWHFSAFAGGAAPVLAGPSARGQPTAHMKPGILGDLPTLALSPSLWEVRVSGRWGQVQTVYNWSLERERGLAAYPYILRSRVRYRLTGQETLYTLLFSFFLSFLFSFCFLISELDPSKIITGVF